MTFLSLTIKTFDYNMNKERVFQTFYTTQWNDNKKNNKNPFWHANKNYIHTQT